MLNIGEVFDSVVGVQDWQTDARSATWGPSASSRCRGEQHTQRTRCCPRWPPGILIIFIPPWLVVNHRIVLHQFGRYWVMLWSLSQYTRGSMDIQLNVKKYSPFIALYCILVYVWLLQYYHARCKLHEMLSDALNTLWVIQHVTFLSCNKCIKFSKLARILGEMETFCTVLLNVSSRTCLPILYRNSYSIDVEQKKSALVVAKKQQKT